jgi:hypothetical protein
LLALFGLILACGEPSAPVASSRPADGDVAPDAGAPIADLLLRAAEKGGVGDRVAATAAWREAYAGFEETVEPVVRAKCDSCATELEYKFGLVRAEIDKPGAKPRPLVNDLLGELEPYLPEQASP